MEEKETQQKMAIFEDQFWKEVRREFTLGTCKGEEKG
jgi:hypothetical protein